MQERPVRILLAEDDPADVFLFRLALADYPVPSDLTVAGDGAAALELLNSGSNFDILVLDLNMPRVGGEEVLSKLRVDPCGARPAITVFVFSAIPVTARDVPGADACVVKPSGLDEYLKTVHRLCDTWVSRMRAR